MKVKVDLCFRITGKHIPVDHGFALYGAVSRALPSAHDDLDFGLKLVRGRYTGKGQLDISPHSDMVLRVDSSLIGDFLPLAGKSLEVQGHRINVGIPITRSLVPAAALHSPLVTTRNGNDQARFEAEMSNQMDRFGIQGRLAIGKRRTFGVHGKQVVGYAVLVSELSAEESIILQEEGLGGRRKMGCGFFEVYEGRS